MFGLDADSIPKYVPMTTHVRYWFYNTELNSIDTKSKINDFYLIKIWLRYGIYFLNSFAAKLKSIVWDYFHIQ